jgi:hypothetical protein
MKKMMILAMMMVMTVSASAMRYSDARREALFLSDKMAYELNLTDAQYAAVYEINLDYLMSVDSRSVYGSWWNRRNADLRYVLNSWQYDRYLQLTHFYRPVAWHAGSWVFGIYNRYNRSLYYRAHPSVYVSYRGGNNRRAVDFYAGRHLGHAGVGHVAHRAPQPGRHLGHAVKPAPRAHKPAHAARPATHGRHVSVHVGW